MSYLFSSLVLIFLLSVLTSAQEAPDLASFFDAVGIHDFNPDLAREGFSSKDFFSKPTVHPFSSQEELETESKRDAFGGFPTDHYRSTFMETRMLQGEYQRSRSPAAAKLLRDRLGSGKLIQKRIQRSLPPHHGGASVDLQYDVSLIDGLVSLDAESEYVYKVECFGDSKMRVHLDDVSYLKEVERWIPGTRFIVSPQWGCSSDGKPQYRMLVRRRKVQDRLSVVEFDTKPLTEQDCYTRSAVNFDYVPNKDLLREELETRDGYFKDSSVLGDKKTEVPAYQTMWRSSHLKSRTGVRYSIDKEKHLDLLNFNYNRASGRASKVIDFVNYKSGGFSAKAQCVNCFAYIGFEFHFKMETSYLSLVQFHATVNGGAKFVFETLLDINYEYTKTLEKKDIIKKSLPKISFSVGPIPVIIHPSVSLDAKFELNIAAKLQITHTASYEDTLTMGVTYDDGQFKRINRHSYPGINIEMPKISDDSQATLDAQLWIIPQLRLDFYAVAPLDLTALPYVRLAARVGNAACGRWGASYNTYWGMDMAIQLQELAIPGNIYYIGGKKFDLGGALPYPKSFRDATFTFISERPLTCSRCSGCVDLKSFWTKRSIREVAPSFLEGSFKRELLASPNDEETKDLELGRSVVDQSFPAAGKCHIYKTSELSEALPADPIFENQGVDTRQIHLTFEKVKASEEDDPLMKIYWSEDEESVKNKTTENFAQMRLSGVISQPWNAMWIGVCNENLEESESTYSIQSKPSAEISRFHEMSPEITVKKNRVVRIAIREEKTEDSVVDRIALTNKQISGDCDIASAIYAIDNERQRFLMDKRYLVLDARMDVEELSHTVDSEKYSHSKHDYLLVADVFGRPSEDESTFQLQANGMFHSHLRKVQHIQPNMNFIQISRSHVALQDIWRYRINVKRSTTEGSEEICVFTGQFTPVALEEDSKVCYTVEDDDSHFTYYIPKEAIELGLDYFMIEIKGDYDSHFSHTVSEISVDEQRFVRSGEMMPFNLRGNSEGGDRFIVFRNDMRHAFHTDKISVSGRTYLRNGLECVASGCFVNMRVRLVDDETEGSFIEKWGADIESDINGVVEESFDFESIKESLSDEDADRIKEFKIVVDVISGDDDTNNVYHLRVDEVTEASESRTEFVDTVTYKGSTEMLFYRIPKSVLDKFDSGCRVDVTSLHNITNRDTVKVPRPQLYVQKNNLPRYSSYLEYGDDSNDGTAIASFFADKSTEDYYIGVTTQSEELKYSLRVSPLKAGSVSITFSSNGKSSENPTFSLDDIVKNGFSVELALSSDSHKWNPHLTDPLPSETCKKLLAHFHANTDLDEWKIIRQHMLDTLVDAFNPESPTEPTSFLEYSEKKLTLHFPPMHVKGMSLSHDMVVSVQKDLDPELFVSRDPRIRVRSRGAFVVERNTVQWQYIALPIIFSALFAVVVCAGIAVTAFIIYKAVLENKTKKLRNIKPFKRNSELKEEFLSNEQGEDNDVELDVVEPEPAV